MGDQVQRECNCTPLALQTEPRKNQQALTFCGPEKDSCVGNQTLKDKSCLVPCTGLYADIEDNSLKHTMQANMMAGFHMLTQELIQGVENWKSGYQERIQQMFPRSADEEVDIVMSFTKSYRKYKREYVKHLSFNPKEENLTSVLEHVPLEIVYIYFDTATYDEIGRDEKVTMEAQLGVIGGTMGLLTGFSILSGVEIIFYLLRFFMSLKVPRAAVASAVNKRFENHLTRKN